MSSPLFLCYRYVQLKLVERNLKKGVLCKDFTILKSKFSTSTTPKIHRVCPLNFSEVLVSVFLKTNKVMWLWEMLRVE